MQLTGTQRDLIYRAGGNANDIAAAEAGEVEIDFEMLARGE